MDSLKSKENIEDYHIRKRTDGKFLFERDDRKYKYVGELLVSFETKDKMIKFSSEFGLNDIKYPFAYGEKIIHFLLHRKYILIQENKASTEKNKYRYLYKKRWWNERR